MPRFQNESSRKTISYENEFDSNENEPVGKTQFRVNGFTRRLVLTQRQNATPKWPMLNFPCERVEDDLSLHRTHTHLNCRQLDAILGD